MAHDGIVFVVPGGQTAEPHEAVAAEIASVRNTVSVSVTRNGLQPRAQSVSPILPIFLARDNHSAERPGSRHFYGYVPALVAIVDFGLRHAVSHVIRAILSSREPMKIQRDGPWVRYRLSLVFSACLAALLGGCGGGSPAVPASITLSLSSSTALVYPGQAAAAVNVNVARQGTVGSVSLSVTGLPAGATVQTQSPGTSSTGSLSFTATTAAAGDYLLTLNATDGNTSTSTPLTLTVGAVVQIDSSTTGKFNQAMSDTIFAADWNLNFFPQNPTATQIMGTLLPQHILLPEALQGVPQATASTWDFTRLDAITQPVLTVGDQSPELRLFPAPSFMYVNGDNTADFLDPTFQSFAVYAQDSVRYYNTGGFTSSDGVFHVSPSYPATKITWWGIYNEPNVNNNLTPQQYVQMYNTLVPAMLAADPSLKFAALELGMNGDSSGQPQTWVPPFVSGVTTHVDAFTTHFYSTCDPARTDAQLFATIPGFVADLQYIYGQMATNPALASVPIWVTENNVDCDASGASNDPRFLRRGGLMSSRSSGKPGTERFTSSCSTGIRSLEKWTLTLPPPSTLATGSITGSFACFLRPRARRCWPIPRPTPSASKSCRCRIQTGASQ